MSERYKFSNQAELLAQRHTTQELQGAWNNSPLSSKFEEYDDALNGFKGQKFKLSFLEASLMNDCNFIQHRHR